MPAHLRAEEARLTIAAAADLSFALKEVAQSFEEATGIKSVLSLGSTGQLTSQIENGAPFDLFFAANVKYMDELDKKGLVFSDTRRLYARGRIVLAVNKKSGIRVNALEDLLDPSVTHIAIANPGHAPYGIAAKEALISKGLWERIKPKIVYGENVRQALQYVQTRDAHAGIVALSVADVPEVSYVLIEEGLHEPIDQVAAVIKAGRHRKEAAAFIDFVNSPAGRVIMKKYGFKLPGEF
ncbi:MAG: molybdate ABC transporter substrate-binding protein [Deltaproteobacteria bacterium]|nr:molybdate ABC transporter substrate-binding protein [Deltaproteobacteria bacterium]